GDGVSIAGHSTRGFSQVLMRLSARNREFRSVALGCLSAVAMSVLFAECNRSPPQPSPGGPSSVPGPSPSPPLPQAAGPAVFVGAGDIAIASGHAAAPAGLINRFEGDA